MITYNGSDLILAPIAGFSDLGFRTLCFKYGVGLCFTEMVSAKGLYYKNENTADLLRLGDGEKNTGVQLFGNDPDIIAEVMGYDCLKKFPVVDINMGCPVPKVVKNGEGSALMQHPEKVFSIISAMKKVADGRKITAKIRAGFYNGYENAPEVAKAIEDGGADMVTIHGRTRENFYSGKANYDIIAKVKEAVKIPVCGNGDVTDKQSYLRIKETTGVDYVMLARGALGKPYIFSEIKGECFDFDLKEAIKKHINYLSYLPERVVCNNMKKQIAFYVKGRQNQRNIKDKIFRAETLNELITLIDLLL